MIEPIAYPIMTSVAIVSGFMDSIAVGGGLSMMPALFFAGAAPLQGLGTNKLQSARLIYPLLVAISLALTAKLL